MTQNYLYQEYKGDIWKWIDMNHSINKIKEEKKHMIILTDEEKNTWKKTKTQKTGNRRFSQSKKSIYEKLTSNVIFSGEGLNSSYLKRWNKARMYIIFTSIQHCVKCFSQCYGKEKKMVKHSVWKGKGKSLLVITWPCI